MLVGLSKPQSSLAVLLRLQLESIYKSHRFWFYALQISKFNLVHLIQNFESISFKLQITKRFETHYNEWIGSLSIKSNELKKWLNFRLKFSLRIWFHSLICNDCNAIYFMVFVISLLILKIVWQFSLRFNPPIEIKLVD